MHQVLVAIDARRPFALHLGMGCFSRRAGRLRILVTGSARETIPFFQLHSSPVGGFRAVLIEFFNRGIVGGKFLDDEWDSIDDVRINGLVKV